jgi:hypothetical protein
LGGRDDGGAAPEPRWAGKRGLGLQQAQRAGAD